MEDIIQALLDVVRIQHSEADGTEVEPFNMNDIVDMAMNIIGRPDEADEEQELVKNIEKTVESLAPDIFPPKTFDQLNDADQIASAASMIENSLLNGRSGDGDAADDVDIQAQIDAYNRASSQEDEEDEDDFDPKEASDLNNMIYANFMQMMGLNDPKVEYPFDRSQVRYGKEKTFTEQLEEERARQLEEGESNQPLSAVDLAQKAQERQEPAAPVSAWELAQKVIDKDIELHTKEEYVPRPMEMPETKSASQMAAEAIARAKEQDSEKLEIEKRAEAMMEEARRLGKDPMAFALHQQEILRYMEKNSDELVSFEDYEDLSPEEKLEIERAIEEEKRKEEGYRVPEEEAPAAEAESPATEDAPLEGTSPAREDNTEQPVLTDEMIRQLSQEVIRENSEMIMAEGGDQDLESLNETIMANIRSMMMSGAGAPVEQESVDSLIQQVVDRNTDQAAEEKAEPADEKADAVTTPEPTVTPAAEAPAAAENEPAASMSAADLAKAAQEAAGIQRREEEERETISAADLAKAVQEETRKLRQAQGLEAGEIVLTEDDLNFDSLDLDDLTADSEEPEAQPEKPEEKSEKAEKAEEKAEESEDKPEEKAEESEDKPEEKAEDPETQKDEDVRSDEPSPEDSQEPLTEEAASEDTGDELAGTEIPVFVLGEHTQEEVDEALRNLETLGLEGDVYKRAERLLLLELAGSEAELDAWLASRDNKTSSAGVSPLYDEADQDILDFDEMDEELDRAFDEDFEDEKEEISESGDEGEAEAETDYAEESPDEDAPEEDSAEAIPQEETDEEAYGGARGEDDIVPEEASEDVAAGDYSGIDSPEDLQEEVEILDSRETVRQEGTSGPRSHGKASRKKKSVVRKKDRTAKNAGADSRETAGTEAAGESGQKKEYQVSVRSPFVLKNSASFMDQFEEFIVDTQENRRLSTGFKKLDAMLRYGLHKGSYFIDSDPMYLKNAFIQQIADRAAESGIDVLFLSTELSRYDLMIDAVSRLSYEIHGFDTSKAVCSMDIMTGQEGANISDLKDELNWYRGRISEHLFIMDQEAVQELVGSMDEVSAGDILEEMIRSVVRDGVHKPVVVIDNIENIIPAESSEDLEPLLTGIRKLAAELGIPIIMSCGYAQVENDEEIDIMEKEFRESVGNMCDVYLELNYADMITEDNEELTREDIREIIEDGDTLLIDIHVKRNRRTMRATCQIQATPRYNYFSE